MFTHYKARPHWAKNHFLNFNRVDKLYPDLYKWKRVYLLFNSDGTFDNEFTRKVGFEDLRDCECSFEKERRIDSNHHQGNETVTQQPTSSRINAHAQIEHQHELHTSRCHHNHSNCTSSVSTTGVDGEVISSQPTKSAGAFLPSLTAGISSPLSLSSANSAVCSESSSEAAAEEETPSQSVDGTSRTFETIV